MCTATDRSTASKLKNKRLSANLECPLETSPESKYQHRLDKISLHQRRTADYEWDPGEFNCRQPSFKRIVVTISLVCKRKKYAVPNEILWRIVRFLTYDVPTSSDCAELILGGREWTGGGSEFLFNRLALMSFDTSNRLFNLYSEHIEKTMRAMDGVGCLKTKGLIETIAPVRMYKTTKCEAGGFRFYSKRLKMSALNEEEFEFDVCAMITCDYKYPPNKEREKDEFYVKHKTRGRLYMAKFIRGDEDEDNENDDLAVVVSLPGRLFPKRRFESKKELLVDYEIAVGGPNTLDERWAKMTHSYSENRKKTANEFNKIVRLNVNSPLRVFEQSTKIAVRIGPPLYERNAIALVMSQINI